MPNFVPLTVLNHQWKDFISRLEILIHLSSQYERIHFHHIDSPLSNSKQRINENQEQYNRKENIQLDLLTIEKLKHDQRDQSIEDIQLNIKTNENNFEKANKRLDGIRQEMADIQKFLNSIHQWKKQTLENL